MMLLEPRIENETRLPPVAPHAALPLEPRRFLAT